MKGKKGWERVNEGPKACRGLTSLQVGQHWGVSVLHLPVAKVGALTGTDISSQTMQHLQQGLLTPNQPQTSYPCYGSAALTCTR